MVVGRAEAELDATGATTAKQKGARVGLCSSQVLRVYDGILYWQYNSIAQSGASLVLSHAWPLLRARVAKGRPRPWSDSLFLITKIALQAQTTTLSAAHR